MSAISKKLRDAKDQDGGLYVSFWCPGCDNLHQIRYQGAGAVWSWNGDVDKPTFSPSVLVWWDEPAALGDPDLLRQQMSDRQAGLIEKIPQKQCRCHSFVTDGQIQFLDDCTHHLAGKTVPIPDLPEGWS